MAATFFKSNLLMMLIPAFITDSTNVSFFHLISEVGCIIWSVFNSLPCEFEVDETEDKTFSTNALLFRIKLALASLELH